MAFKMKGSSYKMGGVKTKDTMAYMNKSPLEQSLSFFDKLKAGASAVADWNGPFSDDSLYDGYKHKKKQIRKGDEISSRDSRGTSAAKMKSPMKNTGSYKTILDEETGKEKIVQTTSDDPNANISTGNDARKSFKEDHGFSDEKIAGMKNAIDGGLKNIYEMKGDSAQRRAVLMDDEIQRKINAGETLTEKETMFQNRALKNVGW